MKFEFMTAGRILFGQGAVNQLGTLSAMYGNKVLLVTGGQKDINARIQTILAQEGLAVTHIVVQGEPDVESVTRHLTQARADGCDMVVAMGGGSALDTGKILAAMLKNPGTVMDYLEVVGGGMPLKEPSAPLVAVPTTAGTGAEVTKNAVISVPEHRVKVSMRSATMVPELALLDPELTVSVPHHVTASTGLDALTQVLEPFLSPMGNPVTDAFCREGIRLAAKSLVTACDDGGDIQAREDMLLASLFGGMALANAKLGAVHGFAGVMGGMYDIPHGVLCAVLLPHVMETNWLALEARAPGHRALEHLREAAALLTGDPGAGIEEGVRWIRAACGHLGIRGLAEYGVESSDFPGIIEKSKGSSSMKGNPLELTDEELEHILIQAMQPLP